MTLKQLRNKKASEEQRSFRFRPFDYVLVVKKYDPLSGIFCYHLIIALE